MRQAYQRLFGLIAVIAIIYTPCFGAATQLSGTTFPLGVNLEGLNDWMHTPMFVDAMKTARVFGPPDAPWKGGIPTDEHGWPTTDFGSCIITGLPHMGGTYHLAFTGKADVSPVACSAKVVNLIYDVQTKRTTADVIVPDNADGLMLGFRNTEGGVKDIHLYRPGYSNRTNQIFTDSFLKAIKPYTALRLMDYMASNGTPVIHWSDRTKADDALYDTGKGGPWEPVIALANESGKDLWINIPYQADDDYVRQLAVLFKATMQPGHRIYLEYSNEVWNWSFPQATYNKNEANKEALSPTSVLKIRVSADDDPANSGYYAIKRIPERLIEIAAIWRDVYGSTRYEATVRPVLASQLGYTFILQEQLDFIKKVYGPPWKFIYGIAGAPYFNMMGDESKTGLNTDQVLADLGKSVDSYAAHGLEPYAIMATRSGVKLLGYEGGVDVGQGEQSLDAKAAVQTDPRMRALLTRYLDSWYANGGGLFMYFSLCGGWGKWGFWGLTDDLDRVTPKTEAVADVISEGVPSATAGITIPGTVTGDNWYLGRWGNYGPEKNNNGTIGTDDFREYLLYARTAGSYKIVVDLNSSAGRATVSLDAGNSISAGPDGGIPALGMTAGLHVLRIECAGGPISMQDVRITQR